MTEKKLDQLIQDLVQVIPLVGWTDNIYESNTSYASAIPNDVPKTWRIKGAVNGGLSFLNGYGDVVKAMFTVMGKIVDGLYVIDDSSYSDDYRKLTNHDLLSLKNIVISEIESINKKLETMAEIKRQNINRLAI